MPSNRKQLRQNTTIPIRKPIIPRPNAQSQGDTGAGGVGGSDMLYPLKEESEISSPLHVTTNSSNSSSVSIQISPPKVDLKKEYIRFCKLYSSEPLDIVASPLEKASDGRDSIVVDLKGRGLRGVDCIALGRILALDAPITQLNLSDCLLLPQGFQALMDGLCKNTRLRLLELRGNNIQTAMTTNLGRLLKCNRSLKCLLLAWNCIGSSSDTFVVFCDGLSLNQGLEILDLRNNQLSAECAIELANALRKNKSLRELDLRWNSIGISGAKALWEALRHNFTLVKVELCGNLIPEEVVKSIEHCIQQQSEREAMMEEYSRRTTLLTRQLQRTEKDHAHEINSIVSVFDAEEAEYKEAIVKSYEQIHKLTDQLRMETLRTHSLSLQIDKLQSSLDCVQEKEETLQKALEIKEQHSEKMEDLFRGEIEKMKQTNETKLTVKLEELEGKCREVIVLRDKIKKLESDFELKVTIVSNTQEELTSLRNQFEENRQQYEERLKQEKEKWSNWKHDVETIEKREIKSLEDEIKTIQQTMLGHIKTVEKGKADAEEEIRNLKISFVTYKTEAEEEMSRMRSKLKGDYDQVVQNHDTQVTLLKEQISKLESDLQIQNTIVRKLESENETLLRQNENLRHQMTHMDLELTEKDSTINQSLARARAEVREQLDQLAKEEAANKQLRSQSLELQEQVATLTIKQNREIQDRNSEVDRWKNQVERRDEELSRLKEEDMRRAALLHEAFLAYMRSTAAATGLPLPPSYYTMSSPLDPEPNSKVHGDGPLTSGDWIGDRSLNLNRD